MIKIRLWSFHPKYLDNVGLSRAINEGISGYKALTGKQKMWQNHSQLKRFKTDTADDFELRRYLYVLMQEWFKRKGYECDLFKIVSVQFTPTDITPTMEVTDGQLMYEWQLYLDKLEHQKGRVLPEHYKDIIVPKPHPLFDVVEGGVEEWEKVKSEVEDRLDKRIMRWFENAREKI